MIEIIKEGQKNFITKCQTCGCEFSYQLIDIVGNSVVCPCCGGYVAHKEFKEPSFVTAPHEIPRTVTQQTTANWIAPDVTIASPNTDSRFDSIQTIHDLCIDYDGFNTVDGLKSLIDDIRVIAEEVVCKEKEELS